VIGKYRKATINAAGTELTLEFFTSAGCTSGKMSPVLANVATNTAQKYPAILKKDTSFSGTTEDACMVDPDDEYSSMTFWNSNIWSATGEASMAYFPQDGAPSGSSGGCTDANIMGAQEFDCGSCFVSATAGSYKKITCNSQGISITSGYGNMLCTDTPSGSKVLMYEKDKCYAGAVGTMLPPVSGLAWELLNCGDVTWGDETSTWCGSFSDWTLCDDECMAAAKKLLETIITVVILVAVGCCCLVICVIVGIVICCVTGVAGCVGCAKKDKAAPAQVVVMGTMAGQPAQVSQPQFAQQQMAMQPQAVQAQVVCATVQAQVPAG